MIANRSALITSSAGNAEKVIRDSRLICKDCNSAVGVDDRFCQECGVSLAAPSKLLALRDFDFGASAKRSAMLIGVVTAIFLSVFAVMGIAASYDAMSEDYISQHAIKLLGANDSVQAAEFLQRLYMARGDKLKPQTLDLLGQALIKRSELYAGRNQMDLAIKDLKDVPRTSAQFATATQRILALVPQPVLAPDKVESAKIASSTVPVVAKRQSSAAEIPPVVAKTPSSNSKSTFIADDVTNYNRLLAAYFEKAGAEAEVSSEADNNNEMSKERKSFNEPPTLKEWVKAGRPDF